MLEKTFFQRGFERYKKIHIRNVFIRILSVIKRFIKKRMEKEHLNLKKSLASYENFMMYKRFILEVD